MTWAMTEKGYSQRRACRLVGIDPRVHRYRSSRPDDAGLRSRLRELSSERRRFGYRRLHILLEREGWEVNWKKLYRIYREERLRFQHPWRQEGGGCEIRTHGTVPRSVVFKTTALNHSANPPFSGCHSSDKC